MSKFKVGDKVAKAESPYIKLGHIANVVYGYCIIEVKADKYRIEKMDDIIHYEEIPNMPDDEIYAMLKPKMDKAVFSNAIKFRCPVILGICEEDEVTCYQENDVKKAIALAYRSGYLRAKKGRPFKIGGEKE